MANNRNSLRHRYVSLLALNSKVAPSLTYDELKSTLSVRLPSIVTVFELIIEVDPSLFITEASNITEHFTLLMKVYLITCALSFLLKEVILIFAKRFFNVVSVLGIILILNKNIASSFFIDINCNI